MARNSEFYKGQRKKRNYAILPGMILLLLFALVIVLFYSTQKYAVITDDGVKIELPLLTGGTIASDENVAGTADVSYDVAEGISIQFDEPLYEARIRPTAGRRSSSVKAIYIPYEDLSEESVYSYADRLSTGNALLMNLKEKSGYLAWYSDTDTAYRYGLNMAAPDSKASLENVIKTLKEKKVYLVAQISCCRDELLGAHSDQVCLRNLYGMYYSDADGYWLDPYSTIVRNYTVELVRELWDMGFDEVVLADVRLPVAEPVDDGNGNKVSPFVYTMEMSTTPSNYGAVCGFAVHVAEELQDREKDKLLSIYLYTPPSLVGTDETTGQDGPLFMKMYDRIYYNTDKYTYSFNLQDMQPFVEIGNVKNRLVPVVQTYIPDNTSWVYIDIGE